MHALPETVGVGHSITWNDTFELQMVLTYGSKDSMQGPSDVQ